MNSGRAERQVSRLEGTEPQYESNNADFFRLIRCSFFHTPSQPNDENHAILGRSRSLGLCGARSYRSVPEVAWFADDRHAHTIGRRLGGMMSLWSHYQGKIRRCLAVAEYSGVSSTPVDHIDVVVLVPGLQVPHLWFSFQPLRASRGTAWRKCMGSCMAAPGTSGWESRCSCWSSGSQREANVCT